MCEAHLFVADSIVSILVNVLQGQLRAQLCKSSDTFLALEETRAVLVELVELTPERTHVYGHDR